MVSKAVDESPESLPEGDAAAAAVKQAATAIAATTRISRSLEFDTFKHPDRF
jgi:hypothetical protein